ALPLRLRPAIGSRPAVVSSLPARWLATFPLPTAGIQRHSSTKFVSSRNLRKVAHPSRKRAPFPLHENAPLRRIVTKLTRSRPTRIRQEPFKFRGTREFHDACGK